ncbi:hypothetical protein OCU04_013211 [Sclerotinia nivalis]|uniref:CCHC-type domain-containing protein n=1 Tax=Sclerotinia nivalis TaxID=352851 RepID=A0A9X0DEN5_9HELO|nr:hypothetical protein OCU04_013211 [Sclerotinia nivalis]
MGPTNSNRSPIVPPLRITTQNLNPVNYTPTSSLNSIVQSAVSATIIPAENPMDLNSQKRINKYERKECFRCRSVDHYVKDCPFPDNRSVQARVSLTNLALLSLVPSSSQIQPYTISPYNLSPSGFPSSGNGARLA